MKKIYLVYAKEINSKNEQFVYRVFALKENAEKFVEESNLDNYLLWTIEETIQDSL